MDTVGSKQKGEKRIGDFAVSLIPGIENRKGYDSNPNTATTV